MKSFARLVRPYIVWAAIMIVLPMLMIVLYAFTKQGNSTLTLQFTFENFARFFSDPVFPTVLWRSLKMAFITTLICIAIGYPVAYYIARQHPNKQSIMVLLITLPMWINMLVRTYAWRGILSHLHMAAELKVYVGMVYNFLPFMILEVYTALCKMLQILLCATMLLHLVFHTGILAVIVVGVVYLTMTLTYHRSCVSLQKAKLNL